MAILPLVINQPAIAVARLEHDRRAGVAARIKVEHDPDLLGSGMLIDKDLWAVFPK
jgi:hypothetical protein